MTKAIPPKLPPQYTHSFLLSPGPRSDLPSEAQSDDSQNIIHTRTTATVTADSCLVRHWLLSLFSSGHPGGGRDPHCSDWRAGGS